MSLFNILKTQEMLKRLEREKIINKELMRNKEKEKKKMIREREIINKELMRNTEALNEMKQNKKNN